MRHSWLLAIAAVLASAPAAPAAPPRHRHPAGHEIIEIRHDPPGELPSLGPRLAPVTIEFFCNLGDGYASAQMNQLLRELSKRHPRRLRILYRLTASGQHSNPHLEAAQEAFVEGRFHEFVAALYQDTLRSPRQSEFADIAARAGVDYGKLSAALEAQTHAATIAANHYYRRRHGVRRVPGLLINGVPYDKRPGSVDELEAAYDEAYAEAETVQDEGVPLARLYPRLLADAQAALAPPILGPGLVDDLGAGERPPLRPAAVTVPAGLATEVHGPAGARVVVDGFCNLVTRNCAMLASALDELGQAYPDEVRLELHPLFDATDSHQQGAALAAQAAECAGREGQFWKVYDQLLRLGRPARIDRAYFLHLGLSLGLEMKPFEACLGDRALARKLAASVTRARNAGITRTPTIVIGGRAYLGTRSFDELESMVDRELAPGLLGRWFGDDPDVASR